MVEQSAPIDPPRPPRPNGRRAPSGARPAPLPLRTSEASPPSSGTNSESNIKSSSFSTAAHSHQSKSQVTSAASTTGQSTDSVQSARTPSTPFDVLLDAEHDFTISPVGSPTASESFSLNTTSRSISKPSQPNPTSRPSTPSSFIVSRPSTPTRSPPPKSKPKPSRLNTANLTANQSTTSPVKAISPGLKHWQQVRSAVLAPTPHNERPLSGFTQHSNKSATSGHVKKFGLVSKAAGRFGFRHAAENVMGYNERRQASIGIASHFGGLSLEEQEEVTRERRKFSRDIKNCLDACALEETKRRLWRSGHPKEDPMKSNEKGGLPSIHTSSHHVTNNTPNFTFDPNFSAFAPLLSELHRHLPAARGKKLWSRTCPHHAAILAELGVAFLPDGTSTDGERQQALEVFGAVVKNWAADNAEEELDRWLWLCRALTTEDRQVRNRGLTLLSSFFHHDPSLPQGPERPFSVYAFKSLASALLQLLYALETSHSPTSEHLQAVNGFIGDMCEGDIIEVDETSLSSFIGSKDLMETKLQSGVEKELLWISVADSIASETLTAWLMDHGVIDRYKPAPILHAAPPAIIRLRALACIRFLSSSTNLIRGLNNPELVSSIWHFLSDSIIPEALHLPDDDDLIADLLPGLLLAFELIQHQADDLDAQQNDDNPFNVKSGNLNKGFPVDHRETLAGLLDAGGKWNSGIEVAMKQMISTADLGDVVRMLRFFIESSPFAQIGRDNLPLLMTRVTSATQTSSDVKSFFLWLSKSHPQLFYKPLFSLAASTQPLTLDSNVKMVQSQLSLISPTVYWTHADPQMVLIVLMGDVGLKQAKGKGKEGERGLVRVKLGRYAVIIELILALKIVRESDKPETRLRNFVEGLETRLGVLLEAEEREADLPEWYKSLMCSLLLTMRMSTLSLRRASWMKTVLKWVVNPNRGAQAKDDDTSSILSSVYKSLLSKDATSTKSSQVITSLLSLSFEDVSLDLLVAIHACLNNDDWLAISPLLWEKYGDAESSVKPMTFLLLKCCELIPDRVREVIIADITSLVASKRASALAKLARIYGWRYQVLSQTIISDRRGPIFHFPARTLEYVQTEIGSPTWVAPHDVQDAALQKFGPSLPFELRQRLMELGWSNDTSLANDKEWEKIPVTKLPTLQGDVTSSDRPLSPVKSLVRRGSSGSGHSLSGKKRKAVVSPLMISISNDQALILYHDDDGIITSASRELVLTLQRNDPQLFLRPFTEGISDDFPSALATLNAVCTATGPGFAYAALNVLVGYLRTVLRADPDFVHYSKALTTIAQLIPNISEMSLRDIRKNKAEHVLLPASIHEEEGGFKLHPPWRDNQLDVQTAQLLILTQILIVSPREVYLVKKMLSNLQIQGSLHHLPFSRAWLILIGTLFRSVNRNYNDRSELRHFLQNVAAILKLHGTKDIIVTTQAMSVFILCSARFRRLFTSMGFTTVMSSVYQTYADGNPAVRDCVEYATRSFYRIHQDTYVYQTCAVISEGPFEALAVYELLSSLSSGNSAISGVASGIKGLNDSEEIEALVAMISRPEIALSEIGTAGAERQAIKIASVSLEDKIFPRENIVRLFVTVIAANPATKRATNFLRLFAALVPHFKDMPSRELLGESVEALGAVVAKGKVVEEASMLAFDPGTQDSASDWTQAKREYVFLVESFARSGGHLGSTATRRTLDMVVELLRRQPESVGPAAASILRELANTHLASTKPLAFLRDIAQLFRQFVNVVDFSGLLASITSLIVRSQYTLDPDITWVIINDYVDPAIAMLASASEDHMAFLVPLRTSIVRLLASSVYLQGDALGSLERQRPSAGLMASLVLPFCMMIELPTVVDREQIYSSLWIRLLRYVTRPSPRGSRGPRSNSTFQLIAASAILSVQIIKIIIIRASDSLSSVKGLWNYIAQYLLDQFRDGDGKFVESVLSPLAPRVVDWIMWSMFELVSLHRSPLQISFRVNIQTTLAAIHRDSVSSRPSSPGIGGTRNRMTSSPQMFSGRPRLLSRSPSLAHHVRSPSLATPNEHVGHSRMPSQHLSPILGHHTRLPSLGSQTPSPGHQSRPSFSDLSARRVSRPAFDAFPGGAGRNFRFPSSAPVRSLGGEKGAIVHLLGAPSQILSATSGSFPTIMPGSGRGANGSDEGLAASRALSEIRLRNENIIEYTRRAVKKVQMVFGYEVEFDDQDESVKTWSVHDALDTIAEQTKIFVEDEFRDVFNPARSEWVAVDAPVPDNSDNEKGSVSESEDWKEDLDLPVFSISSP